jgi:hypothetical protein
MSCAIGAAGGAIAGKAAEGDDEARAGVGDQAEDETEEDGARPVTDRPT